MAVNKSFLNTKTDLSSGNSFDTVVDLDCDVTAFYNAEKLFNNAIEDLGDLYEKVYKCSTIYSYLLDTNNQNILNTTFNQVIQLIDDLSDLQTKFNSYKKTMAFFDSSFEMALFWLYESDGEISDKLLEGSSSDIEGRYNEYRQIQLFYEQTEKTKKYKVKYNTIDDMDSSTRTDYCAWLILNNYKNNIKQNIEEYKSMEDIIEINTMQEFSFYLASLYGKMTKARQNNDKNADELEVSYQQLKSIYDSIVSQAEYHSNVILKYTSNEDFEENCEIVDVTKEVIEFRDKTKNEPIQALDSKEDATNLIYSLISGQLKYTSVVKSRHGVGYYFDDYLNGKVAYEIDVVRPNCEVYEKFEKLIITCNNQNIPLEQIITEDEKQCFYYVYNVKGADAAYSYIENLIPIWDNRILAYRTQKDSEFAKENPVLASLASIIITPFEGIAAAVYSVTNEIEDLFTKGENDLLRSYTYSSGDVMRQQVAADIGAKNQILSFLYSTSMSMADSAVLLAVNAATFGQLTPLLSATLMGSRVYVSTLNDALDRGLSDGQAILLGFSSAAAETVCENFSVNNLLKLDEASNAALSTVLSKIDGKKHKYIKSIMKVLGGAVIQGFSEAGEEVSTEILNFISDQLISGELSSYRLAISEKILLGYSEEEAIASASKEFQQQLIQAFIGGFISGGVMGGLFIGASEVSGEIQIKKITDVIMNEYSNPNFDVSTLRSELNDGNYSDALDTILNSSEFSNEISRTLAISALYDSLSKNQNVSAELLDKIQKIIIDKCIDFSTLTEVEKNQQLDGLSVDLKNRFLSLYDDNLGCGKQETINRFSNYNLSDVSILKALQSEILNSDLSMVEIYQIDFIKDNFSDFNQFQELFAGITDNQLMKLILDERNDAWLSQLLSLKYDTQFYVEVIKNSTNTSQICSILNNINSNYFRSVVVDLDVNNDYDFSIFSNIEDKQLLSKLFNVIMHQHDFLYALSDENFVYLMDNSSYLSGIMKRDYSFVKKLCMELNVDSINSTLVSFVKNPNQTLFNLIDSKYSNMDMHNIKNLLSLQKDILDSEINLSWFASIPSLKEVFLDGELFANVFSGVDNATLIKILKKTNPSLWNNLLAVIKDANFYFELLESVNKSRYNDILSHLAPSDLGQVLSLWSEKYSLNLMVEFLSDTTLKKLGQGDSITIDPKILLKKLSDSNFERIRNLGILSHNSFLAFRKVNLSSSYSIASFLFTLDETLKSYYINLLSEDVLASPGIEYELYSKYGITEFYNQKLVDANNFVNGELLNRIKKSFGAYVSDFKIDCLPASVHFISDVEFKTKYGKDTDAMAYNGTNGTFVNLKYDLLLLEANVMHESLHELARYSRGTGYIHYIYRRGIFTGTKYNGFGEVVTEYLSQLAMGNMHPNVVYGGMHSGYDQGVLRLKKLVDNGILDVDKVIQGYFYNDISYIQNAISELSDVETFNKMMDLFDGSISDDYNKYQESLIELDKIITELCIKKKNQNLSNGGNNNG